MKHRVSKYAICDFYKHEDTQVIYCEGVQEGSVIHLAFANKTDAKKYKMDYCRKDYKKCPIADMLRCMEGLDE